MRAVIYCRVSTDEESQVNALADQVKEAKDSVKANGWRLIDTYIDEGRSGTSTRHRDEYKRLFDDMGTTKYDVVVIKSQDRLMRNTKEWYRFIDAIIRNQKKLFFYLENKFYTPDDALVTGIKAILAEEYSRELSKKIKNAHKNRQQKGESILITSRTWGYDKVDKKVVINEKEAQIVRLIFDLCIQGHGSRSISKELSNRGIRSRMGTDFAEGSIRRIIRNPLFMGTVIMNQRSTNFDTKQTIRNSKEEWKIHKNAVPAIVTEDIWYKANAAMDKRATIVKTLDSKPKTIGRNIGKYHLSGKIKCGLCHAPYWRRYRRKQHSQDEMVISWSCSTYVKRGRLKNGIDKNEQAKNNVSPLRGCDNIHMNEQYLYTRINGLANRMLADKKEAVIAHVVVIIKAIFGEDAMCEEERKLLDGYNKCIYQRDLLMDKLLNQIISDEDYKRRIAQIDEKISEIKKSEKQILKQKEQMADRANRIKAIEDFLEALDMGELRGASLVNRIDQLIVYPDRLEVCLDFCDKIILPV